MSRHPTCGSLAAGWLPALAALALGGCGSTEPIPHEPAPGQAFNAAGVHLLVEGKLEAAERQFLAALAESESIDDLPGKAKIVYNLGLLHRDQGKLDAALEELRISEALFRRLGDADGSTRALAAQGSVHFAGGSLEQAEEVYARARGQAPAGLAAEVLANLSAVFLCQGQTAKAREAAAEAVSRAASDAVRADALFNLAQVMIQTGDLAGARAHLLEVANLDRGGRRLKRLSMTLVLLAQIAASQGNAREASDYYERAAGVLEGLGQRAEADKAREASRRGVSAQADPK